MKTIVNRVTGETWIQPVISRALDIPSPTKAFVNPSYPLPILKNMEADIRTSGDRRIFVTRDMLRPIITQPLSQPIFYRDSPAYNLYIPFDEQITPE